MSTGREEFSSVSEAEPVEAPETNTETESNSDGENRNESTRETVARAFKELSSEEGDGDQSGEDKKPTIDPFNEGKGLLKDQPGEKAGEGQKSKPDKTAKNQAEFDPDLVPPPRLDAAGKELFNNLPKGLKKGLNKTIKDLEGMATRSSQEYARAAGEARGYLEAVQPYIAEWGQLGFSGPAGVAALAATQSKLMNPKTRLQTYLELGSDLGIDVAKLSGSASNGEVDASDISTHPVIQAMQNENNALRENLNVLLLKHQQTEQTSFNQGVDGITAEFAAVRDEMDQTGRYRYPELHDEAFLESTKPLVSALIGTVPGITYGDALKQSWAILSGKNIPTSNQANRVPATGSNNQARAAQAAVSVRGRTASLVNGHSDDEIPPEALKSTRATVAYALEMERRRARG